MLVVVMMADEVGGRHAVVFLEALRKVAGRSESAGVGDLGNVLPRGGEKLAGTLHALDAENLHGAIARELLAAAVHLCTAEADGVGEAFNAELGVSDVASDDLHEALVKEVVLVAMALVDDFGR